MIPIFILLFLIHQFTSYTTLIHLTTDKLERDLTEISSEINMKQQLIDQLTESHKKMAQLKVNYEEKIYNLENKIKLTENERDKILTTMC